MERLTSFNTCSLIGLCPPRARHGGRLWENKPAMVLAPRSSWSSEETFIHVFTQPPPTEYLLVPGTFRDTENLAENRTVSSGEGGGLHFQGGIKMHAVWSDQLDPQSRPWQSHGRWYGRAVHGWVFGVTQPGFVS